VYANNRKAREVLGWELQFDLDAMMATSWAWEQRLAREQAAH
jgi:UDP-glucose 4-epimerase